MTTEAAKSIFPSNYEIKHIICPIDLVSESDQGLRYSVALARTFKAKITLLHVSDVPLPDGGVRAKEKLAEMILPFNSGESLNWEVAIGEGDAGEVITNYAKTDQASLIVMLSRRRPFAAAMLGSTAETVSLNAPCPVLIMHPQDHQAIDKDAEKLEFKRILIAYNYSQNADAALSCALPLMRESQSELHLINVLPIKPIEHWTPLPASKLKEEMQRLETILPSDIELPSKLKAIVAEGQPYDKILAYSEENKIDLICIGAHHGKRSPRFNATVNQVLREASCPVLVCRSIMKLDVETAIKFNKVLLASDGSTYSEMALNAIVERYWPMATTFRVITVLEPLSTLGPNATHYRFPAEVLNALEKVAASAAEKLKATNREVSSVVREGMAANEIIQEAKDWGADLIVVGTHSRHGISRFLLGSVAERVASHAPCSVEIVRKRVY